MSRKSPAVAYYARKIKTTSKSILIAELKDAPIDTQDFDFMMSILDGLSYEELSKKYHKSKSRIYQWKRTLFETLHYYDMCRMLN